MSKFKIFVKSILVPVIIGAIVGFLISNYMDYNTLNKPFLSPPAIVFPIVWTILYVLMGISYGILQINQLNDPDIDLIYYSQLFFNALWSIIFFVFKWRFIAYLWILILIVLITVMIIKFYERNKLAGLLQIPYLIWVLFASYLNLSIFLLNN